MGEIHTFSWDFTRSNKTLGCQAI